MRDVATQASEIADLLDTRQRLWDHVVAEDASGESILPDAVAEAVMDRVRRIDAAVTGERPVEVERPRPRLVEDRKEEVARTIRLQRKRSAPYTEMTDATIVKVVLLALDGRTYQEMVREVGIPVSAVRRALMLVDHPEASPKTLKVTEEDEAAIFARYRQAADPFDLADEFDISIGTVLNIASRGKRSDLRDRVDAIRARRTA